MEPAASTLPLSQFEKFEHDGYLIFPGMAPDALCDEMLRITHEHLQEGIEPLEYEAQVGYAGAPASLDSPGGKTVRRLRAAYQRHACFATWADNIELQGKVAALLGEKSCLTLAHHNSVMTKHPDFGTATGWHRDIRYWSYSRPDLISVWLALGNENAANGGLKFIPGSHRLPIGRDQLDELDFLIPEHPVNQALFTLSITPELRKGDVVFFHSKLFHAAGRNTSPEVKTSVVFAYRGKSNLPVPGSRSAAEDSLKDSVA